MTKENNTEVYMFDAVVNDRPFKVQTFAVEHEYPAIYNGYVSRQACINDSFIEALEQFGLYRVHEGHWSEKFHVAESKDANYLTSKAKEVYHDWLKDMSGVKFVSLEEFAAIIKDALHYYDENWVKQYQG